MAAATASASASDGPRYAPEDPTLPKPWKGLVDGNTGYLYYWNPETNITQYERPGGSTGRKRSPTPPKSVSAPISSSVQVHHSSREGHHRSSRHDDDGRHGGSTNGGPKLAAISGVRNHQSTRGSSNHLDDVENGSVRGARGASSMYDFGHSSQVSRSSTKAHGSDMGIGSSMDSYRRQHEITVSGDDVPSPFTTFESTGFPSEILREVHHAGFSAPTPIQAQTWPIALQGQDIVAIAKTGSGKTLGYLLPGFMHLKRSRNNSQLGPTVLVLSPTRELATQILQEAVKFSRSSRIACTRSRELRTMLHTKKVIMDFFTRFGNSLHHIYIGAMCWKILIAQNIDATDWWKGLLQKRIYKEVDYSGKMVLLLDILSMSSAVGDKVLIFSQSLTTLDLIEYYLSKLPRQGRDGRYWKQGKDWYRLDGSTEGSERQKLVERFNEPMNTRVKCTLISTRAGSMGINLHAANRVIIFDGSWNPTHDLQATYRVWRFGQKKAVYAYRLMAHGTMEEKIYKRQVTKESLAARVVDKQQIHRTMSKEEMLHLFDFGDDENFDAVPEESHVPSNQDMTGQATISLTHKLPNGSCSSDRLMERLLGKHYPRWIANYHEHETLLQENEDEKLSKEEQDQAWELYLRQETSQWEEVHRVSYDDSASAGKPPVGNIASVAAAPKSTDAAIQQPKSISWNQPTRTRCTRLGHSLVLRSLGTKVGCSTVCGGCGQEISWENLTGKDSAT